MRVAVVGATGVVGREMVRTLEARSFPVDELVPLASARSEGKRVAFRGEEIPVGVLSPEALRGVDLALFSAGASVSREIIPPAADAGTVCVDNSSAFRRDPAIPLVIPELNADALAGSKPIRLSTKGSIEPAREPKVTTPTRAPPTVAATSIQWLP